MKEPTIEGLRHARDQLDKLWKKERQRAADLKKENERLWGLLAKHAQDDLTCPMCGAERRPDA